MKGVTGLEMLVAQAKQAIEYFLGTKLEDRVIEDTYQYLLEVIRDQM
jgi:shikimate dehydrogenase